MNPQATIKKYITRPVMKTVGLVFLVATVVLVILGIMSLGAETPEAVKFSPVESENGAFVYVDAVGVSSWVYQYGETIYYTLLDADDNFYTVHMTEEQFAKMKAQNDYFNDDNPFTPAPDAYRLEGMVRNTTAETRKNIAQAWGIPENEYVDYFGEKHLDATATPGSETAAMWFVFAVLSMSLSVAFLVLSLKASANAKKCLRRLEELGLTEKAAQQLINSEFATVVGKKKGILTEGFLFGKGTGMAVAYSDILWCYQSDRRVNLIPVNSYLMVGTKFCNVQPAIDMEKVDKKGLIAEAIDIIAQRNPATLTGYSGEAARAFHSLRKEQ